MEYIRYCPHCGSDQRAEKIPQEYIDKGYYGDSSDASWDAELHGYYWRTFLMEEPEVYDGGLYYQCPDCDGTFHRWPEGHPLRFSAEEFVFNAQ